MAELKTKVNNDSVTDFLNTIEDEEKRADSFEILKLMKQATKQEPRMWGSSIVGFGHTHYVYESGREGDWFITGFSPRKQNLTLYVTGSYNPHVELLEKLGRHKTGVGCLYINKLRDVDVKVLKELIKQSVKAAKKL
ncbi:MAG: DUF1801 domain-containing protein [Chloroflexi bacterium]|jgi:hypothetical protein|nr:DUF1801 domain-containing protein [Chloroflexota bacterium]